MWFIILGLLFLQSEAGVGQIFAGASLDQFPGLKRRDETDYSKVIGGRLASYGEFPFMLSLEIAQFGHFCGGSAIGEYWGMTAAHCVMRHMEVVIRAGSLKTGEGGTIHHVKEFITRDFQIRQNFEKDIALIKLVEPFSINSYVKYVSLPLQGELVFPGDIFDVTGWGLTKADDYGSASSELKLAEVEVLKLEECQNNPLVGGQLVITDSMICAQRKEQSAYKGDSGGPLFRVQENGRVTQLGIVSWGDPLGLQAHPAVFTRVSAYRVWIYLKTGI